MQICLQFSQPRCQRSQFFFSLLSIFLPIFFANDKRVFLEKKKKKKERKKERESTSDGNWAQSLSQMKMAFRCMNCRRLFWTHSINIASIISIPLYSSSCSFFFFFKNQQKTNTKTKTHLIWRINPMCDFDFCPTPTARNNVSLSLSVFCVSVCSVSVSEWECEEGVQNSKFWERAMRENF